MPIDMPPSTPSLSNRDKTRAPHGFGYYFHHTNPQRRVPCVLGDMLAPLSADDIPPITAKVMASVQAALTLLAQLVGDRDHGRFLGACDVKLDESCVKARDILLTARGLAGILRVEPAPEPRVEPVLSAGRREGDQINWSDIQHGVGDMHVQLPDGTMLEASHLVKGPEGQWLLITKGT